MRTKTMHPLVSRPFTAHVVRSASVGIMASKEGLGLEDEDEAALAVLHQELSSMLDITVNNLCVCVCVCGCVVFIRTF